MGTGRATPRQAGGFTYLGALLAVAILGVGLAAVGTSWSDVRQRENEEELVFVGEQFRAAIGSYYEQSPGLKRFPKSLGDLLKDDRYALPRRHLRRLYRDPMTGKADWGLVEAPDGGIMGVFSRGEGKPFRVAGTPGGGGTEATSYGEWKFVYVPVGGWEGER